MGRVLLRQRQVQAVETRARTGKVWEAFSFSAQALWLRPCADRCQNANRPQSGR